MTKPEWEMHVPAFRLAVVDGGCTYGRHRAKVWHDNEMFLASIIGTGESKIIIKVTIM